MKRIFISILILVSSTLAFSQAIEKQKKEINSIKKSNEYIYAETTLENEQEAIDIAQELLYQRINEYIAQKKKFKNIKEAVIVNRNYSTEKIQLPRGNMYRAFVYVKKSDILPSENAIIGKLETIDKSQSSVEMIEDKPSNKVVEEICRIKTLAEMKQQLPLLKREGKIISYASYKELANPENFLLIIYNKQGEVLAFLSEGKDRKNLKTNLPDDIHNYKGTGAVGVKIK